MVLRVPLEEAMRKWYMPLTVLGLGSLGILMLSDRGRDLIREVAARLEDAPENLREWNDSAQAELDRIQAAVDRVAQSLQTAS
jgi:HPt (histidine-containing phosphotransfer) domain-containing protein